MKKTILLSLLGFLSAFTLGAQLDRSQRPEPGPAPVIQLGEFETFTMDNGMTVIVVENRQVPVISFQLTLDIDPVLEGDAKGYVDFAGQLMREGTKNRSKQEIDEAIDFIGASLSTYSTGMFASSLTRHKDVLLDIMADILLNPVFPEEELQRRITQTRTGLQATKTDASAIARNVAQTQAFGYDHPYGEIITEETLDNITVEMLREYYNTYFKPNMAYLVIVGDINAGEAKEVTMKYFSDWQPAEVPTHTYPTPEPPDHRRVAFAERRGTVQSVINVTYPVVLPPGHEDAIKVSLMNSILGGGVFSGRLMQNLREDKGYTYGARSSINNDPLVSRFTARTEVRNEVTDSTITEILYEMNRMIQEPVDDEELEIIKNFMTGQFARSLENPRTMARFALNIQRYGLPEDYYASYLENLNAVAVEEVQQMAQKYLKPNNSVIVVAGNMDEVPETLKKISDTGEVEFFDAFGQPYVPAEIKDAPDDVTVETVLNKYFNAIGGRENFKYIHDIKQIMKTSMMGMDLTITYYRKAPNLLKVETAIGDNVMSTQVFDGTKLIVHSPMGKQKFTEGEEYETMKLQSILNLEMNYKDYGIEKTLEGIENIDEKDAYRVEVISPTGEKTIEYYDMKSGFKLKTESPESFSKFSDYRPVSLEIEGEKPSFFARLFGKKTPIKNIELKFPHKIEQQAQQQTMGLEVEEIKINSGLDMSLFEIE